MKGCSICPTYNRSLGRCSAGRIFPKTIKGGVQAASVMGVHYLCAKSPCTAKAIEQLKKLHNL